MHALHRRIDSHVASCIQRNSFTSEMPSSIIGGETFKIRFVRELSKRKGIKPGTIIVVRCNFMTGRQTDAKCVIIIMVIIAWNRAEVLNGYVIYCAGQTVRSLFARPLRLMPATLTSAPNVFWITSSIRLSLSGRSACRIEFKWLSFFWD